MLELANYVKAETSMEPLITSTRSLKFSFSGFESHLDSYSDLDIMPSTEGLLKDLWDWLVNLIKRILGIAESRKEVADNLDKQTKVIAKNPISEEQWQSIYERKMPHLSKYADLQKLAAGLKTYDDAFVTYSNTRAADAKSFLSDWDYLEKTVLKPNITNEEVDKCNDIMKSLRQYLTKAQDLSKLISAAKEVHADISVQTYDKTDYVTQVFVDIKELEKESDVSYKDMGYPTNVKEIYNTFLLPKTPWQQDAFWKIIEEEKTKHKQLIAKIKSAQTNNNSKSNALHQNYAKVVQSFMMDSVFDMKLLQISLKRHSQLNRIVADLKRGLRENKNKDKS